jgi:hypothetical protein
MGCLILLVALFGIMGLSMVQSSDGAGSGVMMFFIAAIFLAVAAIQVTGANKANAGFPARIAKWKRQFMCTACGFIREQPA